MLLLLVLPIPVSAQQEAEKTGEEQSEVASIPDKHAFTGKNFDALPWKSSIMFKRDKLDKLYKSMMFRDQPYVADTNDSAVTTGSTGTIGSSGKSDSSGNLEAISGEMRSVTVGYALNSVMFYNPESWTLWLNSNRVRKGHPLSKEFEGIEIREVRQDAVEFLWFYRNLDVISPGWNQKLAYIGDDADHEGEGFHAADDEYEWEHQSDDGTIMIDSKNGVLLFRLGINQTFRAVQMDIVEGIVDIPPLVLDAANQVVDASTLNDVKGGSAGKTGATGSTTGGGKGSSDDEFNSLVDDIFDDL